MFPASRAGLAAGEHQGHVEPGLVHTKPVIDSAVSAASLHQQRRHTRRLRHQHRPPSKEPESGEDNGLAAGRYETAKDADITANMDGHCLPRRGRGRSREPVRLAALRLRLSACLEDLHTAAIFAEESTSEGLTIRLPAAARKMTFRRLSGPFDVSRQERCSRICTGDQQVQARGQYDKVTGYDNMACDNSMRHARRLARHVHE